jgi:predicted metalloprotease
VPVPRLVISAVLAALLTAVLVLGTAVLPGSPRRPGPGTPSAEAAPASTRATPRSPFGPTSAAYGPLLRAVARDLDRWWSTELPRVYGRRYVALRGWYPATPESLPPSCGAAIRYRDLVGNAFYCQSGDYITFDDAQLFPALHQRFGDVALAVVMAHEMAHAIQARTRTTLPTVYAELQADCFAGAWLRRAVDGQAADIAFALSDLDEAIAASLTFRDSPGISAVDPNAHGNGFDRTSALQTGFDEGNARCRTFATSPPRVTAKAFSTAAEAASGGDIALEDAVALTLDALGSYFGTLVDTNRLRSAVPTDALARTYRSIGDVGASMLVVERAADDVEAVTRVGGRTTGSAELRSTCLAGSWLGAADRGELSTRNGPISLSPGDLDEAMLAMIDTPSSASAFDRIRALRTGWATTGGLAAGLQACARL